MKVTFDGNKFADIDLLIIHMLIVNLQFKMTGAI